MMHYLNSLIARTLMEPVPSRVVMPRPVSVFEAASNAAETGAGFLVSDTTTAATNAAPGRDDRRAGPVPQSTGPATGLPLAGRPARDAAPGSPQETGSPRGGTAAPPGPSETASGLRSDPIAPASAGESGRTERPGARRALRPQSDVPSVSPVSGGAEDVPPATLPDSGRTGLLPRAQTSMGRTVRDEAPGPPRRQTADRDAPRPPVTPGVRAPNHAAAEPEAAALKAPSAPASPSPVGDEHGAHVSPRPETRSAREAIRPTTQIAPSGTPAVPPQSASRRAAETTGTRPAPADTAAPAEAAAPVVRVTIGRVDVRAVLPPPVEPPPRARQAGPTLSLDDYLKQGRGGA